MNNRIALYEDFVEGHLHRKRCCRNNNGDDLDHRQDTCLPTVMREVQAARMDGDPDCEWEERKLLEIAFGQVLDKVEL